MSAITIFVGPQKTPFVSHKEFLCEASGYFRAALTGRFAEANKNEINLPEQKANVFDGFLAWLYIDSLDSVHSRKSREGPTYHGWEDICDLYVFAKYIQCPKFSNHLLNTVLKRRFSVLSVKPPGHEAVTLVYQSTPAGCGLQKLVVALFLQKRDEYDWKDLEETKDWISKFPAEFCHEVLVRTTRQVLGLEAKDTLVERRSDMFMYID